MSSPSACILVCSPRVGGNSDQAARRMAQALQDGTPKIVRLADRLISPCKSCGICLEQPGICALSSGSRSPEASLLDRETSPSPEKTDQALDILQAFCLADVPCFISPIYFYHLPAQAKALIDRCQAFYAMPDQAKPGQGRPMGVILLGARQTGRELFSGALLTLHYAALCLGLRLADPLLLYGLENAADLAARPDLLEKISDYAQSLRP